MESPPVGTPSNRLKILLTHFENWTRSHRHPFEWGRTHQLAMSKPVVESKHLNIALTASEYEKARHDKDFLGLPYWRDVVLLGAAAIRHIEDSGGNVNDIIRKTYPSRTEAARVAGGMEAARLMHS